VAEASGKIHGAAASSLDESAGWAHNRGAAASGSTGERRTERLLNELAVTPGGPTVLHDLRFPRLDRKANIDHVVVSGDTVTIIDSKLWRPGLYWSFGGRTRRGLQPIPYADRSTLADARRAITAHLRQVDRAIVAEPIMVVWPSENAAIHVGLMRPGGARAISGERLARVARRRFGDGPGNEAIVERLMRLVRAR